MVEGSEGVGPMIGSEAGSASKCTSSLESAGDRLRFTVELRPEETTIVSWKKLLREANSSKSNRPDPSLLVSEAQRQPVSQPPPPPSPVAPVFSEATMEKEQKDSQVQAGSNRLSNVIERIERMYAGNGSSDEEDVMLDNVPDDDEYDTNDSFIDDAELDDYFQVDNSATKHHGFFVNRGKLERVEPTISTNQQPRKRRHKDLIKGHSESDGHNPKKIAKIGNKGGKASLLLQKHSTTQSHRVPMSNTHGGNMQFQTAPANAAEVSIKKKTADPRTVKDSSGLLNGGAIRQDVDVDGQRSEVLSLKNHSSEGKESEPQDTSPYRSNGKSSYASKVNSGKQLKNVDDLGQSVQQKEKGGIVAGFDLNVPVSRDSLPPKKAAHMPRKEGSSIRTKSTTLEKAIRELEKIVAEYRPPSTEVQDPDNSSQAVKRRLPFEIKQKLAKVARLAQGSYGKIPMDVVHRLMSIVGHLMQISTLKRNLKNMANMGLSAKKEKDDRIEKIKQVAEMVKERSPYMKSKAEQQAVSSDNFQEAGPEEKEALKHKYSMDDVLGNKTCGLRDHYVERAEEDSDPPARRLYEEKAAHMPRKEGSSVRTKSTKLEKAIWELEKIVSECRPPSTEVQNPDNSSQAIKRRLPIEIKLKLAKVARLAQGSYGKIPMDVINRLMSIVGHLMQISTLKRNLKNMANMGLSAKKEKDDRIEKIKQEVAEMVKQRIPYMKSKAEQQAADSDDFQEAGPEEKEALKRKFSMDDVLGNKICDLYDLYIERVEEGSGPPARKLYQELVVLWPSGFMDTDEIKRAIYRAKDRRGLCSSRKDREKIKKKVLPPEAEDSMNVTKALDIREKSCPDSCSTLNKKPVSNASRKPDAFANGPKVDNQKQEKAKGSSNGNIPIDEMPSKTLPKKKIKKKPNPDALDAQVRLEKMAVSNADEGPNKHHKHVAQSN